MKKSGIFWILTAAVFVGVLLSTLVQEGMFLDGITYSSIANNLANGYGSVWDLHYTKILDPHFFSHPPLFFVIQSWFFKVFGDAFFTERIYCLFTSLFTLLGIVKCWQLFVQKELKEYSWLPVIIWLTIPIIIWSYKNNLLDNTMGVFTVFSVFFILKSLVENKIIYLFIGSVLIVLAFLTKGFTGVFPLVVPVIYAIVYQQKKSIWYSIYLIFFITFIVVISVIVLPELTDNMVRYFNKQLFPSLNNELELTTTNRFNILFDLLVELSFPIILLIYFAYKQVIQHKTTFFFKNKSALIFFLIALSASLPLIITLKQRKFYLIPSIPFYILAISILVAPSLKNLIDGLSHLTLIKIKKVFLVILGLVIVFMVTQFGKYSRDQEKLSDIYTICREVPEGSTISITKDLWTDWSLAAYMNRIGHVSLDCDHQQEYLLIEKGSKVNDNLKLGYKDLRLQLIRYDLLKKIE